MNASVISQSVGVPTQGFRIQDWSTGLTGTVTRVFSSILNPGLKVLSQMSHSKGFSPVWMRWCFVNLGFDLNVFHSPYIWTAALRCGFDGEQSECRIDYTRVQNSELFSRCPDTDYFRQNLSKDFLTKKIFDEKSFRWKNRCRFPLEFASKTIDFWTVTWIFCRKCRTRRASRQYECVGVLLSCFLLWTLYHSPHIWTVAHRCEAAGEESKCWTYYIRVQNPKILPVHPKIVSRYMFPKLFSLVLNPGLNFLSQMSHSKGFSLVWTRRWHVNSQERLPFLKLWPLKFMCIFL